MARRKDFVGIYKPNNKNTGSVMQVKLSSQRDCMFLEFAPQVRPKDDAAPYDWKNQGIVMALGPNDIGMLLALFSGEWPLESDAQKPDMNIYHQTDSSNKTLKIKKQANGYYVKIFANKDGKKLSVAVPVNWQEAQLIKVALWRGYEIILGW